MGDDFVYVDMCFGILCQRLSIFDYTVSIVCYFCFGNFLYETDNTADQNGANSLKSQIMTYYFIIASNKSEEFM